MHVPMVSVACMVVTMSTMQDGDVDDFTMLDPKDLMTCNLDELRELARDKRTEQAERRRELVHCPACRPLCLCVHAADASSTSTMNIRCPLLR